MQKPLRAIWNCFFSGSYVYVQLFHFNGNENNLLIAIKVKLLKLHVRAWEQMLFLEENVKWHLEAFASEVFKYSLFEEQNLSKKE